MKQCPRCTLTKATDQFYASKWWKHKDGLRVVCKECSYGTVVEWTSSTQSYNRILEAKARQKERVKNAIRKLQQKLNELDE